MAKKPRLPQGMKKEHIRAELQIRFGTVKAFAEQHGKDESYIRGALVRCQPAAHELIARALDKTPAEIWPQYYNADALKNPRLWRRHIHVSSPKSSTAKTARVANLKGEV